MLIFAPALAAALYTLSGGTSVLRARAAPARARVRAMFSDSRPTIEYMEFLRDGEKWGDLQDCASTIVGGGRLGRALYGAMGFEGDVLLKRGESIPAGSTGPIHVCVPNDELTAVLDACPDKRVEDLVFWQAPWIEPVLKRYALTENTQVCAYFFIPAVDKEPVDVTTDVQPEGLSTVTGKWATAVIQRLARQELTCKVLNKRDFRRAAIERHIGICSFNAVGTVQGHMSGKPLTLGQVERFSWKEVELMQRQLGYTARTLLSAAPASGLEERLRAYARARGDLPCEMRQLKWRNGFWYDYSQLAIKNKFDDPTPLHTEYVQYCVDNGLIAE
jgi:hypothetical protein